MKVKPLRRPLSGIITGGKFEVPTNREPPPKIGPIVLKPTEDSTPKKNRREKRSRK